MCLPHNSPSSLISIRAIANDSSSLDLYHLSTIWNKNTTCLICTWTARCLPTVEHCKPKLYFNCHLLVKNKIATPMGGLLQQTGGFHKAGLSLPGVKISRWTWEESIIFDLSTFTTNKVSTKKTKQPNLNTLIYYKYRKIFIFNLLSVVYHIWYTSF